MNRRPHTGVLVLVVTLAVVVASCTSDSADSTTTTEGLTTTTPTTIAAPTTTVAAIEETTTTTEVAAMSDAESATIAAYETAWNDGNEDAFRALFAPGAVIEKPIFSDDAGVDRLLKHNAGHRTMEVELSIDGCSPSGETVICTAEFDGLVPIAMNQVPWRDRYIFSFEDGQITHIKVSCIICWDGRADDRLRAWVKTVDNTIIQLGYNLPDSEEKAAAWLEWAPKWQEAGRP